MSLLFQLDIMVMHRPPPVPNLPDFNLPYADRHDDEYLPDCLHGVGVNDWKTNCCLCEEEDH